MEAPLAVRISQSRTPEVVGAILAGQRDNDKYRLMEEQVLQEAPLGSDQQKELRKDMSEELTKEDEPKEEAEKQGTENVLVLNESKDAPVEKLPEPAVEEVKPVQEPTPPEEVKIEINKPTETPPATEVTAPVPEITKVEESKDSAPDQDAEMEKLEKVYKNIGRVLIDGWREYVRDYDRYKETGNTYALHELVRKTVLDVARISVDFNMERKKQNQEAVDFYLPILSVKEIYNQIMILRLTDEKNPKHIESLDGVMANEIKQLIEIGQENRSALEEYLPTVVEQLNYWRSTEHVPAT